MNHEPPPPSDGWRNGHNRRKNLKDFCRGNPKFPHAPEIRWGSYASYWLANGRTKLCGWNCWYRAGELDVRNESWHYSCWHEMACTRCGKVTCSSLKQSCPSWVELDDAVKASVRRAHDEMRRAASARTRSRK